MEDGKLELGVVDFCTNLPGISLRSFLSCSPCLEPRNASNHTRINLRPASLSDGVNQVT